MKEGKKFSDCKPARDRYTGYMDPIFIIRLTMGLVVATGLLQMGLVILLLRQKKMTQTEEELLESSQLKSQSILSRAMRQANRLLVTSELKGIKALSQDRLTARVLEQDFHKRLDRIENALTIQFERVAQETDKEYGEFLHNLETRLAAHVAESRKGIEAATSTVMAKTQEELGLYTENLKKAVTSQVDAEFSAVRTEIDEYRERRLKVLDERIIDVLEDVVHVALEKKLDLSEHSELIYRALEFAKKENAFGSGKKLD